MLSRDNEFYLSSCVSIRKPIYTRSVHLLWLCLVCFLSVLEIHYKLVRRVLYSSVCVCLSVDRPRRSGLDGRKVDVRTTSQLMQISLSVLQHQHHQQQQQPLCVVVSGASHCFRQHTHSLSLGLICLLTLHEPYMNALCQAQCSDCYTGPS